MPRISHGLIPSLESLADVRDGSFAERPPLWYCILTESASIVAVIIPAMLVGFIRNRKGLIRESKTGNLF